MRLALLALLLCVLAAAPARAECTWRVITNISPPQKQIASDSGTSWPSSFWTWQYVLSANHLTISGTMSAYAYHCTTNLSSAASGNGTYTVERIGTCCHPQEDIEGDARNEFKARAELRDDSFARAQGSQRIKGSKMDLDCHVCGGVEATSSGYGSGSGGTITVPIYPQGPSMILHWSKGATIEQAFQAADSGTGGQTPERVTCQTNLDLSTSVGWWDDEGVAMIKDSKAELKVYGTCDGCCGKVQIVINVSVGY